MNCLYILDLNFSYFACAADYKNEKRKQRLTHRVQPISTDPNRSIDSDRLDGYDTSLHILFILSSSGVRVKSAVHTPVGPTDVTTSD